MVAPQTWRLTEAEQPFADELGELLWALRTDAGLTQKQLAGRLAMSPFTICRIERAQRRTRRSTLREIALILGPATGRDPSRVLAVLVETAGPALAAETRRSEGSIARKRKRKQREALKHDQALINAVLEVDEPVKGGPKFMLRRRVNAALTRAFGTPF